MPWARGGRDCTERNHANSLFGLTNSPPRKGRAQKSGALVALADEKLRDFTLRAHPVRARAHHFLCVYVFSIALLRLDAEE